MLITALGPVAPAAARSCGRTVIFTLPAVTWSDVARYRPPHLLAALRDGAAGSMAVRTIESRTSLGDGFATLGAGARVEGPDGAGGDARGPGQGGTQLGSPFRAVTAAGVAEMRRLAREAGYGAEPGALGSVLGRDGIPVAAVGNADPGNPPAGGLTPGRWTLLAAMDASGAVRNAAVGASLLRAGGGPFGVTSDVAAESAAVGAALAAPCAVVVVDEGDLERADLAALRSGTRVPSTVSHALQASDSLLGAIRARLDPAHDLLLVVTPASPAALPAEHLGVALAVGPGFAAGAMLVSASTRRTGFVTLPDVAPTVLSFLGIKQPAVMNGQPWRAVPGSGGDRVTSYVSADREASFIHRLQPRVATVFVVFQVLVYLLAVLLIARREGTPARSYDRIRRALEAVVLFVVAFPAASYVAGIFQAHSLGVGGTIAVLLAIDAVLVSLVTITLSTPLDRLLGLTAFTCLLLIADLALGAPLQLSTVFGYSPIVAGRFAGIGNIGFAVLAASSVLTGALVVHRMRGARGALIFTAGLFLATIVADGLPALGSDVGGVIALVPALIVTWVLLGGRRPTLKVVLLVVAALAAALGLFLAVDLARPPASQTHLARLFEDVRARGGSALGDTIARKARANLRVFTSTVWTLWVPPALALLGWLLLRPRGRWQMLVETYPHLRAGLVGALLVGILGFATNDSGIVIPAMVLSFFVPLAVLLHLSLMDRQLR